MSVQLDSMRDSAKPQQIVDAAVRVFARNGFYNSRVSDIAREARIASGTIYLYFKTKIQKLVTVVRDELGGLVSAEREAIAEQPRGLAQLRRIVRTQSVTRAGHS